MSELAVLQAVRLKGRVTLADLSETLVEDPAEIAHTVEQLTKTGLLADDKVLKLTREGRARLDELLAEERRDIDGAALLAAYDEFRAVNRDFKAAITDWQLKDGQPNMHRDGEYDSAVLARIEDVHRRVLPIIAAATARLPRLSAYSAKLQKRWTRFGRVRTPG